MNIHEQTPSQGPRHSGGHWPRWVQIKHALETAPEMWRHQAPSPKEDSRHSSPAGGSLVAGPRLPGPEGTPCPKPGVLISTWPLHTEHKPLSFLCESCPSGSFAFPPPSSLLARNTAGSFSPPASCELCPLLGLLSGSLSSFMFSLRGTPRPPTTQSRMDLYCFLSLSKDCKLSEGKNPV